LNKTAVSATQLANKFNLYLPRYKTNRLQRSFKYQDAKIWNSIPDHLRQNISFNSYKNKLKKHFIEGY